MTKESISKEEVINFLKMSFEESDYRQGISEISVRKNMELNKEKFNVLIHLCLEKELIAKVNGEKFLLLPKGEAWLKND